MRRIYGWLETEKIHQYLGNQLYTSLLTIGSSGLTGHGFREVLIRFPEPQTDFIFFRHRPEFRLSRHNFGRCAADGLRSEADQYRFKI